jgi:hypothetical protein
VSTRWPGSPRKSARNLPAAVVAVVAVAAVAVVAVAVATTPS